MRRWGALGLLAGLAVLAVVIVARTARFAPRVETPAPAAAPAVDAEAAARRLAEGLRLPTISHQDPERLDREAFLALHDHLQDSFPRVRTRLRRETVGELTLLYTWPGRNPGLPAALLMAHQDVVPVDEADWHAPPFGGQIDEDGTIWGRGAIDDKGNLYAILEAAELLLAADFRPERTLYFSFGHDEELGGERGARAVAALLEERGVELAFVLDEGGFLVEGLVPGVARPLALVAVAEKGSLSLRLAVDGHGGHSSIPPRQSTIGVLARAIARLEDERVPGGLDPQTRGLLEALAPELPYPARAVLANLWLFGPAVEWRLARDPTTDAMLRTTTAVTMMRAGVKSNVMPARAEATVNFRIHPRDTTESVLAHVRRVVDDDRVAIEPLSPGRGASPVSPVDSEAFALIEQTIREVFPGTPVVPFVMPAGTDAKHFYALTPNVYRFSPFTFGRDATGLAHGTDERIATSNLARGIGFYAHLMRRAGSS